MTRVTTVVATAWRRVASVRLSRPDVALGALGVLFGSASLAFPFGRDQGLFYYVGREWLERGAIPYKDTFEQKTPGVFMLHALSVALFGEQMWGIRLFELLCVAGLGLICASLTVAATAGRAAPLPGVRGASVLAASVLYFGMLDYWDTAQCEIWGTTACAGALLAATRAPSGRRGAFIAGVLGGAALVMKPPTMWMVGVLGLIVVVHAYARTSSLRRPALAIAAFAAGVALVVGSLLAYFAAHGALDAMYDVIVRANLYYRQHESYAQSASDVAQTILQLDKSVEPTSGLLLSLLLGAFALALYRRDADMLRRYALVLAMLLASVAGVVMQLKLYAYHFGLCEGPIVLLAANVAADVARLGAPWLGDRRSWVPAWGFATVLLAAFSLTRARASTWWDETAHTVQWLTGRLSRQQYADTFALPWLFYDYRAAEDVGLWLREHTQPNDTVSVRGFEPEIYVVSRRHRIGRFFWTLSLDSPEREYRRAEWLAEERTALIEHPPTWVVAPGAEHAGPESAEYFCELGYRRVAEMSGYVILRHAEAQTAGATLFTNR